MGDGRPLFVRDDGSDRFFLVKTVSKLLWVPPPPLMGILGVKYLVSIICGGLVSAKYS